MIKERWIERRINKLVSAVKNGNGMDANVFLDAGAIIDFETEARRWKIKDNTVTPQMFYTALRGEGIKLYVSRGVMEEVEAHHRKHCINGNPETSRETFETVAGLHDGYLFDSKCNPTHKDPELIGYDVYWSGLNAFPKDHKKSCIDHISRNDRGLIVEALSTRYSEPFYKKVIILSPDSHISETVKYMTDKTNQSKLNGGPYDGIRVVSSR